jgi:Predicted membrane protein (DUF2232)
MPRKLKAIEIAEGALLADIAVIFHLLIMYLPVGGDVFRLLIPIVFAVLVLRRGFYVGIIGLCVVAFVTGLLTGIGPVVIMLFESGAGLFLGLTMRHRLRHFATVFLGVTSSSLIIFALFMLTLLVFRFSLDALILRLHQVYNFAIATLNLVAVNLGLTNVWKYNLYPIVATLANWGFTYWWVAFYIGMWIALWPVVIVVYYITNLFVRLLGYDVLPFPGGMLDKLQRHVVKLLIRQGMKRGLVRKHA